MQFEEAWKNLHMPINFHLAVGLNLSSFLLLLSPFYFLNAISNSHTQRKMLANFPNCNLFSPHIFIIKMYNISKLHSDVHEYKLKIQIQISLMRSNSYSAGQITGISSEKRKLRKVNDFNKNS